MTKKDSCGHGWHFGGPCNESAASVTAAIGPTMDGKSDAVVPSVPNGADSGRYSIGRRMNLLAPANLETLACDALRIHEHLQDFREAGAQSHSTGELCCMAALLEDVIGAATAIRTGIVSREDALLEQETRRL